MATGLVYSDFFKEHKTGYGHPERPERLDAVIEGLKSKHLLEKLVNIEVEPASVLSIGRVHSRDYIEHVKLICSKGPGYIDSFDTPVSEKSYDVALLAAGGAIAAADKVMDGKVDNAFCALRPPGHHAEPSMALGFCLFNNIAVAAEHLKSVYDISRILIVDWDVHHGNGTQDFYYSDPSVLYFSIHEYPHYPGTGAKEERGKGAGEGFTLNSPVPAGLGDKEYIEIFNSILVPEALKFNPQFILISCGFDPHERDPLSDMRLTASGFGELTCIVKEIASQCCEGRIVSLLEGGYDYEALKSSAAEHINALLSER